MNSYKVLAQRKAELRLIFSALIRNENENLSIDINKFSRFTMFELELQIFFFRFSVLAFVSTVKTPGGLRCMKMGFKPSYWAPVSDWTEHCNNP